MRSFIFVIMSSMFLFFSCSNVIMQAGSSVSGNGKVSGCLLHQSGVPASHAQVMMFLESYNPVLDTLVLNSLIDTTDAEGKYAFINVNTGTYDILAVGLEQRYRAITKGIHVNDDSVKVPADTLRKPGTIKVVVPNGFDANYGYFYIPGTTIYSWLSDNNGSVMLDSVPAGVNLSVYYAVKNSPAASVTFSDSIVMRPGEIVTISYPGWKFSKKLYLNTTASGANIAGAVTGFPALVRLTGTNFKFSEAKTDGADLRFTKSNGDALSYEIERWDASQGSAEIWVKVDTVFGRDSTHFIVMYWGASTPFGSALGADYAITSLSNGAAVFDTASGFQGVWHLGEAEGAAAGDATGNHFDGTPSDTTPTVVTGPIGYARQFNGTSSYIRMKNTAAGKLNFVENSFYTVSAWAYADTFDDKFHVVVGKSDEQYFLKLKPYYPPNPMRWEFVEFHDQAGWQITDTIALVKTWSFLVGIRKGNSQYFYLNGELVDSVMEVTASAAARYTGDDVTIGKYLSETVKTGEGMCPFPGRIDEVRISNVVRSADWIKLCYMNQKTPDALFLFK
jgi:hypothetical protein